MIEPTEFSFDLEAVSDELARVEHLLDPHNQIGVTSRPNAENPLYDAVGWLPEDACEADYRIINSEFRGTALQRLLLELPFRYGRSRLMRLAAKSCLSIHADPSRRYHYAIRTNPDAYIVDFNGGNSRFHHIPADGRLYRMDAHRTHTAINAGRESRVHLVICNADPEQLLDADPVGRRSAHR